MRICTLGKLLLIVACIPSTVRAATYSTPVEGFGASGEFGIGSYNFGYSFNRIDDVFVEVTLTHGISQAFCTGSYCASSYIAANLAAPGDSIEFPIYLPDDLAGQYPDLYGEFHQIVVNGPSVAAVSPPNWRIDPATGEAIHDPWPDFVFSGAGLVGLQEVTFLGCILNCESVPSGISGRAPTGFSAARIIVEGSAVPEPSTISLLYVIVAMRHCYGARRYRFSSGKPCDDGACALHR